METKEGNQFELEVMLYRQHPLFRYGASVVVQLGLQAAVFSSVAYNPQCFLQLEEDSQLPPLNWNEVRDSSDDVQSTE